MIGPSRADRRHGLAAVLAALAALGTGCAWRPGAPGAPSPADLRPVTVEGPSRTFLVVELVREAHVAVDGGPGAVRIVEACRWHVNADGALYGDHWGWCEDFTILPRWSPGYLIATTLYAGGANGGYSALHVLPRPPSVVQVFGRATSVSETGSDVQLEFGEERAVLQPRRPVRLGEESGVLVEPPPDTGHFDPGGDQPLPAEVKYWTISHGRLDSRRIAGRNR